MLWAITSHFNPAGYVRRLQNYRIFRRNLSVPLLAIELSFNGEFELRSDDAEIVIRVIGRDVLWHKERLLNLGIRSLPDGCGKVAWLDCDIVFESKDWAQRASEALEKTALVQLYSERCNLSHAAKFPLPDAAPCDSIAEALIRKVALGRVEADDFRCGDAPLTRRSTAGLAWAARRDLLQEHMLYDACILGSGDRAIVCAATGNFDYCAQALHMGSRQFEHYLAWARPFYEAARGQVGYIDGRIFHLWHGDLKDRKYTARHQGLHRFGFDPFADLALDDSGCWRWNGAKSEMHEYVRRYFASRNEDAAPVVHE